MDASLTFSLDTHHQWQWSGNIVSHDRHNQLPDLAWRGKIIGKSVQDFQFLDTQLSFGKGNRLQMAGGCPAGQVCAFKVTTQDLDAQRLLKAVDIREPFNAALNGTMELKQKNKGWQLEAELGLRHVRWGDVELPDATMNLEKMRFSGIDDFQVFRATITPVKEKGEILLSARRRGKEKGFVSVTFKNLDAVWVQLGNIALNSSALNSEALKSHFSGKGPLSGTLDWVFNPAHSQFGFELDATTSQIALGEFSKPAGLRAELIGHYRIAGKQNALSIGEAQLGNSFLKKADWRMVGKKRLVSVASGRVDIAELRASGLKLPKAFDAWHGRIEGGLDDFSMLENEPVLNQLAASSGLLLLNGFGIGDEQWSGKIVLKKGNMSMAALHWQRGEQFADVAADLDANTMRGRLDILRGQIAWSAGDGFPDSLATLQLRGKFTNLDLTWDDNLWQGMHGDYVWKNGVLALSNVRGGFAGGYFQSRQMKVLPVDGGMDFDGRLQMSAVYLEKITGLANSVGADMHGYIFFNGLIGGHLPLGSGAAWRGNGDIEINKGRWNEAKAAHLILWRNDSGLGKQGAGGGFSRLTARYRFTDKKLELSHLKFNKADMRAQGAAEIGSQGNIRGHLDVRKDKQTYTTDISGRWPSAMMFFGDKNSISGGAAKQ